MSEHHHDRTDSAEHASAHDNAADDKASYDFASIERKWQAFWDETDPFA